MRLIKLFNSFLYYHLSYPISSNSCILMSFLSDSSSIKRRWCDSNQMNIYLATPQAMRFTERSLFLCLRWMVGKRGSTVKTYHISPSSSSIIKPCIMMLTLSCGISCVRVMREDIILSVTSPKRNKARLDII